MAESKVKYCKAISQETGKPCRAKAMLGNDYCNMHAPEMAQQRSIRSHLKRPRIIITKLEGLRIKDTADMAIAIKKIIEDILRKGHLSNSSELNVFNGLVKTAILLEQNAEVPKLIKRVESQLNERGKQLSESKKPL